MAENDKDTANLRHIRATLCNAVTDNRTYNDIWLIRSVKDNGSDTFKPELLPITFIVNSLPKQTVKEVKRNSVLINYTDGDTPRTFAHIFEDTNGGVDKATQWIVEIIERAMSDLFHSTYKVQFAITEHISNERFIQYVTEVAKKMLDNPTSYDMEYRLPAYIAGILRIKGEHSDCCETSYTSQLEMITNMFATINAIC